MRRRVVRQKKKGPIDPSFGLRLRALRLAQGKTQAAVAGSHFTKGYVSLIETGRTRVSLRAAEIIAGRLGVPLGALFLDAADATGTPTVGDLLTQALRRARELEEQGRGAQRDIIEALSAWKRLQQRSTSAAERLPGRLVRPIDAERRPLR